MYSVAMLKIGSALLLGTLIPSAAAFAQIQRTSIPIGNAIEKALAKASLTGPNARPFHILVNVSEPENHDSPYVGTVEMWWISPQQWRREVTDKEGLRQTIVVTAGKKTEKDEGDYFPFWLREFVDAVTDPVPNAAALTRSGLTIEQITMPNGAKSDPCVRAESKIGTGDRATDAFTVVCFDSEWRFKEFVSPSYSMGFQDYKGFGKKQIARKLVDDPEPGTELVGSVIKLEELKPSADLFQPLATNDNRFLSAHVTSEQMENLTANDTPIQWPTV